MKTIVEQIQEVMECAEQGIRVVEVRPVSSAKDDEKDRKEQADTVAISGEARAN